MLENLIILFFLTILFFFTPDLSRNKLMQSSTVSGSFSIMCEFFKGLGFLNALRVGFSVLFFWM